MRVFGGFLLFCLVPTVVLGQAEVDPRIVTETNLEEKVAIVEVAPRFVTTIRLPEAINSVAVGDPSHFQAEHSDREPKLLFVKAVSTGASETNLLISTVNGREISLLLVSRGESPSSETGRVDFLLRYQPPAEFFIAPSVFPPALIAETVPLTQGQSASARAMSTPSSFARSQGLASSLATNSSTTSFDQPAGDLQTESLEDLVEQQEIAPLPVLYGQHIHQQSVAGDSVRVGVGRIIDGGQRVIVLFSVVNPAKHAIWLMPPQVQLGGRTASGKLIRHTKWSTAEQLVVMDFRLSARRIGPGERADGVVVFDRPPYKQSNETLLLQVAESGAVDRPALAPIGFGVSTASEGGNGKGK